jgi:hypothetical protein
VRFNLDFIVVFIGAFHKNLDIVHEHHHSADGGYDRVQEDEPAKTDGTEIQGSIEQHFPAFVFDDDPADAALFDECLNFVDQLFAGGSDFFEYGVGACCHDKFSGFVHVCVKKFCCDQPRVL